jgi:hypothetical protein
MIIKCCRTRTKPPLVALEAAVKPLRRTIFLFVLMLTFSSLISAQDGSQSLGDIAR